MDRMGNIIQAVLIVAAMSSLNSGLYSTGRILRSLGMAKQAPGFTLKMSSSGVPWAGMVVDLGRLCLQMVLNALRARRLRDRAGGRRDRRAVHLGHDLRLPLRLRKLVNRGIIPASPFQAPGYPWTSYLGLAFLVFVVIAMAVSGWQSNPYFWHKVTFIVVVIGIPLIAAVLTIGWLIVEPHRGREHQAALGAVWTDTGPAVDSRPSQPAATE